MTSTCAGSDSVIANQTGGAGGAATTGAIGGAGAASTLTNAVKGSTNGGTLSMTQNATGEAGGATTGEPPAPVARQPRT